MAKKKRGGPREGTGPKPKDGAEGLKGNLVLLDKETEVKSKRIGNGNKSLGIRIAVKEYREDK